MSATFERPVGAAADVKELEYIAALLQTSDEIKEDFIDASIDDEDIKYYLISRHGLKISREQVRETILEGFGGGNSEGECLDICEIVAALFIPTLRKIVDAAELEDGKQSGKKKGKKPFDGVGNNQDEVGSLKITYDLARNILEDTLRNILFRATGSARAQPLTPELIRKIFAAFDEMDLVQDDDLVSEMIKTAKGKREIGEVFLDVETLACALTFDIMRYDPLLENRATTHFLDAIGGGEVNLRVPGRNSPAGDKKGLKAKSGITGRIPRGEVTREFTIPWLDFAAETFRSRIQVIFVYVGFMVFYLVYKFNHRVVTVCSGDSFECSLGQSVVSFLIIMAASSFIGTLFFGLANAGNDVTCKNPKTAMIAIGGSLLFFFAPLVFSKNLRVIRQEAEEGYMVIVLMVIGSFLIACQLLNVLRIVLSEEAVGNHKYLQYLVAGSNARNERSTKQAADYKITQMLLNAFKLHTENKNRAIDLISTNEENESTHELALLNFTKVSVKTETVGGFLWAWKSFLSGSLHNREGIWIHSRIYAGLAAQLALFLAFILAYALFARGFVDNLYKTPINERCTAIFDIGDCEALEEEGGTLYGFLRCDTVIVSGDNCLDDAVIAPQPLRDVGCDFFRLYYNASCDEVDVVSFGDLTATALRSNILGEVGGECNALMSACILVGQLNNTVTEIEDDVSTVAACLIGMDQFFSPYWFWGPKCNNLLPIRNILESRPPLLRELGDAVYTNYERVEEDQNILNFITPEEWMVRDSMIVGFSFGIVSFILLLLCYIPSTIHTIMQFRYGVIGSLRDPKFLQYRKTVEDTTYIFAFMAWGSLFSAASTIFIFSGITFIAVWEVTKPFFVAFVTSALGIFSTIGIKSFLVLLLDRFNYAGFYRKVPKISNILGAALEGYHIAIAYAYLVIRSLMLIGVAGMNVGRIDRPFFGSAVGTMGGFSLDKFPLIYRKDILLADAHRHPYIERLGLIYMMKLKLGERFAKKSGSMWRLLFVFSLMPWLRRYRITNDAYIPEAVLMEQLGLKRDIEKEEASEKNDKEVSKLNNEVSKLREENHLLKTEIKSWLAWQQESISSHQGRKEVGFYEEKTENETDDELSY
mmetsp:Transcript_7578/g.10107  ORF Transcript_7578/g.10107 Transcript_7578/m.10107 type:complete len:1103 (-) Transcript_7578:474-3782(-)